MLITASLEELHSYALSLVGQHVMVRTYRQHGSTVALQGLTGIVASVHPIAYGWVKIHLDPTHVTQHHEWSIAADCLVPMLRH